MIKAIPLSLCAIMLLLINSCASFDSDNRALKIDKSGNVISNDNPEFVISGELDDDTPAEYFGLINFTFNNNSDKWVRIENIRVYFDTEEANENVVVTAADDIIAWQEAMDYKIAVDNFNSVVQHAVIAGLGQGLSESESEGVSALGDFITLAAIGSLTIKSIDQYKGEIEYANIFPESHLLAKKFSVPPGLFAKKWILLNTSDSTPYISSINLELTFNNGEVVSYKLKLRDPIPQNGEVWQSKKFKVIKHYIYKEP